MPFKQIGLSSPLVKGILATGYTAPTEIQSRAIPAAIAGKDIIGSAQTGTGKTAAFVLPMLEKLVNEKNPKRKTPRSLILTPTRELAVQIERAILGYSRFLDIKTLAVYGGVDIRAQVKKLRSGVDIIVATPGRLIDHMQRGNIDFKQVAIFVLDEADRMFDMGFINDIRKIIAVLPKKRQTMLFSATITKEVKKLSGGILQSPVVIQIGHERNPAETVTQHIYPVDEKQKIELLLYLLQNVHMYSVLVFSRTRHGADKIRRRLAKANVLSIAIHSDRTQKQRQRALDGFRAGKYQVMVATDIAARGIDVDGISHVINYDVPRYAEDYIHRIGRTGRAESTGDAITFISQDEVMYLHRIEKYIGHKFKAEQCEGFEYVLPVPTLKSSGISKQGKQGKKTRYKSKRKKTFGKGGSSNSSSKPTSSSKFKSKKTSRKFTSSSDSESSSGKRKYSKKAKPSNKKFESESSSKPSRKFKSSKTSKFKSKSKSSGQTETRSKSGGKSSSSFGKKSSSSKKKFSSNKKSSSRKINPS